MANRKPKVVNPGNARTDEMMAAEAAGESTTLPDPDRDQLPPGSSGSQVVINRVKWATIMIPIMGLSPLIMHAFGAKARKKMLDEQTKEKTTVGRKKRDPRDVDSEYEDAFYRLSDGRFGFPAFSLKRAMVGACRQVESLPMTVACGLFHIMADDLATGFLPLVRHSEPERREDVVRLQTGVASVAIRPQFTEWALEPRVRFNPAVISLQSVVNLLELAGSASGLGDWRPERKGGPFGMFCIDAERFGEGQQKAA